MIFVLISISGMCVWKKILFWFNDPGNNCDFGWNVKHFSLHYKEISSFLDRTVKGLIWKEWNLFFNKWNENSYFFQNFIRIGSFLKLNYVIL